MIVEEIESLLKRLFMRLFNGLASAMMLHIVLLIVLERVIRSYLVQVRFMIHPQTAHYIPRKKIDHRNIKRLANMNNYNDTYISLALCYLFLTRNRVS